MEAGHLPRLYNLVFWKSYPEEKDTWEPASAMQHLQKLVITFHKDYPNKPIVMVFSIDTISLIARPNMKPSKPTKSISKVTKAIK